MKKDCYNCRYYGGENDTEIYCDYRQDFVLVRLCDNWRRDYSCTGIGD